MRQMPAFSMSYYIPDNNKYYNCNNNIIKLFKVVDYLIEVVACLYAQKQKQKVIGQRSYESIERKFS